MKNPLPSKYPLLIACLIASLIVGVFYHYAALSKVQGHISIINGDTLIYYAGARSWAEGHPYTINAGDPRSTAWTSHLYPPLLALLYRCGFDSHKLIDAVFLLNGLFLLLYIAALWGIIQKVTDNRLFQGLALLLTITNGHVFLHFLGQSDMGFFTLSTGLVFLCFLLRRYVTLSILTLLLPFIRPEGAIMNVAYMITSICIFFFSDQKNRRVFLPSVTGLTSILLLAGLNYSLTGNMAFDSTSAKGLLFLNGISYGILQSLSQFIMIINHLLMGSISAAKCGFITIPVIGVIITLLAIAHFSIAQSELRPFLIFFILSITGTFLVISTSGDLAYVHHDRYFTWIFPIIIILQVCGIELIWSRYKHTAAALFVLVFIFNSSSMLWALRAYQDACMNGASIIRKADRLNQLIPPNTKVLVSGCSGIKYFTPDLYIMNYWGIGYAPLRCESEVDVIERWRQKDAPLPDKVVSFIPGILNALGPLLIDKEPLPGVYIDDSWSIYNFDNSYFSEKSLSPLLPDIQEKIQSYKMTGSLNLGYNKSEQHANLKIYSGLPRQTEFLPQPTFHTLDGLSFCDPARPVAGSSTFEFKVTPDQSTLFVIRLIRSGEFLMNKKKEIPVINLDTSDQPLQISFNNAEPVQLVQTYGTNSFTEIAVPVNTTGISGTRLDVKITGLYIPSACWLYQSDSEQQTVPYPDPPMEKTGI